MLVEIEDGDIWVRPDQIRSVTKSYKGGEWTVTLDFLDNNGWQWTCGSQAAATRMVNRIIQRLAGIS